MPDSTVHNPIPATSRTAIFGGTFDPIHNAHVEVAREAAERFSLSKVLFVPAFNPPHKEGAKASYADRVRMCELACEADPRFEVSRVEEGTERSYSILTIEKLLSQGLGPLSFLIGADAFAEVQSWYRWREVVELVEFIIVTRPGAVYQVPEGVTVRELPGMDLAVSSSEIRARLQAGCFDVPVPPAVAGYIRSRHLYQSNSGSIELRPRDQ